MADIHSVKFQITAQDAATRIFQGVERGLGSLRTAYVAFGAAVAGGAILTTFMARAIALRSQLDDLADTTGDNVKTLDGLRRQAVISGVSLDNLGSSLSRLARNLHSADDDGKAAGAAIKAIGLSVEDLQAKKPGEALVEIAKALDRFEDGASKVAVATALMGREGAKMLPYLKDLAESGELQGRISGEQAAAAERLEKEWRKLGLAFEDTKQEIATGLIPGIKDLLVQLNEGAKIAGGFGRALLMFGTMSPFRTWAEHVHLLNEELARLRDLQATAGPGVGSEMQRRLSQQISDTERQREWARFNQRQEALALPGAGEPDEVSRRFGQRQRLEFKVPDRDAAGRDFDLVGRQWAEQQEREIRIDAEAAAATDEFNVRMRRRERMENIFGAEAEGSTTEELEARVESMIKGKDALDAYEYKVLQLQAGFDGMDNALEKVTKESYDFGFTFNSALEDAILNGESLRNVVQALGRDIARAFIRRAVTEPLTGAVGGALGAAFSGLFTGSAGGGEIHAQHGADFKVSGSGGVDSQLVRFWATPGERVTVTPPGKAAGDTYHIDARGADREGLLRLEQMIRELNGSIEYRAVAAAVDYSRRGGGAILGTTRVITRWAPG